MNDLQETITVEKRSEKGSVTLRKITLEEIPVVLGSYNTPQFWTLDRNGKAARIRTNGGLKTWKRDATRFEQGFKWGMYEAFRWTTQQMLDNLYLEA